MQTQTPTAPVRKIDAHEASMEYYRREAVKTKETAEPTPIEQMFGYYAA